MKVGGIKLKWTISQKKQQNTQAQAEVYERLKQF
jgi:hypothetical protein